MPNYQRIKISTGENVGEPGPLPDVLVGLDDSTLADLPAAFGVDTLTQLDLLDTGFIRVADPPPPAPDPRLLTPTAFLRRIQQLKRIGIRIATGTDPVVADFWALLNTSDGVDLEHEDTIEALDYFVAQGLLTADDVTTIRA